VLVLYATVLLLWFVKCFNSISLFVRSTLARVTAIVVVFVDQCIALFKKMRACLSLLQMDDCECCAIVFSYLHERPRAVLSLRCVLAACVCDFLRVRKFRIRWKDSACVVVSHSRVCVARQAEGMWMDTVGILNTANSAHVSTDQRIQ
jgi:hypothetical protein